MCESPVHIFVPGGVPNPYLLVVNTHNIQATRHKLLATAVGTGRKVEDYHYMGHASRDISQKSLQPSSHISQRH